MDNTSNWYDNLNKPEWAPANDVFGKVWSFLYPIIFFVNGWILYKFLNHDIPFKVALPFWLNLFFNLIFSPIQFGLRNNLLAAIDIVLVLATILWSIVVIFPYNKVISLLYIPYLIWVSIATVLQISILIKN